MEQSGLHWTIEGLGEEVARRDRFAGGGAVAAMTLVGAAATAELVFELSSDRRKLSEEDRRRLKEAAELCEGLRPRFRSAIDQDIAALSELMDALNQARRERKSGAGEVSTETADRRRRAVTTAIETPLDVARQAGELLRLIADLQHLARAFTASDLGAAAAALHGAMVSLLLMAEVNLGLLERNDEAAQLAEQIDSMHSKAQQHSGAIVERTRQVIRRQAGQDD